MARERTEAFFRFDCHHILFRSLCKGCGFHHYTLQAFLFALVSIAFARIREEGNGNELSDCEGVCLVFRCHAFKIASPQFIATKKNVFLKQSSCQVWKQSSCQPSNNFHAKSLPPFSEKCNRCIRPGARGGDFFSLPLPSHPFQTTPPFPKTEKTQTVHFQTKPLKKSDPYFTIRHENSKNLQNH